MAEQRKHSIENSPNKSIRAGEGTKIKIQKLDTSHVDELVKLHKALIPYSINSLMGEKYLSRVYRQNISKKSIFGFIAIDGSSNQIVAFITLTSDLKAVKINTFRCLDPKFIIKAVMNLTQKTFRISVKDFFALSRFQGAIEEKYIYLLGWGALKNTSGIGLSLFSLMISLAGQNNSEIWLDVRKKNTKVIENYKNHGFLQKGSTSVSEVYKLPKSNS